MPVSILPADTAHLADSAARQPLPTQPEAVSQNAVADTTARPVIEVPETVQAQPFARSPLHDTPSMALLLTGVLAVTLCYHKGYKYIENFFHYMFSTRRRENLFEDHTVNETSILAALIANTCIVEGFIIYFAVQLLWPDFAPSLKSQAFTHIAAFSGMALGFYLIQWLVYKVMGYTFSDQTGAKLWIDGFKSTQSLLGLVLLPVLVLLMLYPAHGKMLLAVAAALYFSARIIFIFKGFRIFYSNLSSILYFLLYLCAVEIAPLIIMMGVTHWICGILQ